METFALYGSPTLTLDEAAADLASALGVRFEARWSDYWGGDYFLWRGEDDEIAVRTNAPDEDGVPIEAEHPAGLTLVYVTTEASWDRLSSMIERSGRYVLLSHSGPYGDVGTTHSDGLPAPTAELSVYERSSSLEYFENVWADRWPEFWWGYWGLVLQRFGLPVSLDQVDVFRSETGSAAFRDLVAAYLDEAPYAVVGQTEPMSCQWCDRMFNGAAHRSDGTWVWPEDLGHAVRDHGFVVPNRLVDHIRELGSPPQRVFGPDDVLPWPKL